MTKFREVKYMEPALVIKPGSNTKNAAASKLRVISKKSMIKPIKKHKIESKSLFNKIKPKRKTKKNYLLPGLYRELFVYFNELFLSNKVKEKDLDNMSDAELRVYADRLMIRNEELKAYSHLLKNWRAIFKKNEVVKNLPNDSHSTKNTLDNTYNKSMSSKQKHIPLSTRYVSSTKNSR